MSLTPSERVEYTLAIETLKTMLDETSRQRAEAFLRTLGKWEEVQK